MTFGVTGNVEKPGLHEAIAVLLRKLGGTENDYLVDEKMLGLLREKGVKVDDGRTAPLEQIVGRVEMLVAFGGDGTILATARAVGKHETPILGINLGKLGFLAELAPEEMARAIGDILEKKYIVETRLVLQATSPMIPGKVLSAVNDVVVDKSRFSRVIDVEVHINGAFAVTYRGDGLIVSTPTGSTAYALSNGGPIVVPTSNVLGITPISPHTLSGRPLVVPDSSVIRTVVHSESREVLISSDGQQEAFLRPPVELTIQKAPHSVRLVKRTDRTYFDVLRAKLLWGKDVRSI